MLLIQGKIEELADEIFQKWRMIRKLCQDALAPLTCTYEVTICQHLWPYLFFFALLTYF